MLFANTESYEFIKKSLLLGLTHFTNVVRIRVFYFYLFNFTARCFKFKRSRLFMQAYFSCRLDFANAFFMDRNEV